MTDTCPNCGADIDDDFAAIADLADREVMNVGKQIFESREQWDADPNTFLQALLAGMLTGIVGIGFSLTAIEGRDSVMEYLREYLELARQDVEDGESGTVQ
jgi:hypothetical protein